MDLNLSDFMKGQIWPILPAAFDEMSNRMLTEHLKGNLIQQAAAFNRNDRQSDFYQIVDNVAVIPINGPLMKRMSFMSFFFGGTSYAYIKRAVREAIEDSSIDSIVLRIDSPGGVVSGVESTADLIFKAKDEKPIVTFTEGMMASAAYWIGSAADTVIAEKTSQVGSIGVLLVHSDWSRWNEKEGIKYTYLTAGKYKALGNPDEPLSDLARETFQDELNYIYSIFINTVARNRGIDPGEVRSNMADGKIFIGQQSEDVGLVDNIGTFETAIERAKDMAKTNNSIFGRVKTMKIQTVDQLKAEYGDLVNEVINQTISSQKATYKVDLDTAVKSAREDEKSRIVGLAKVQFGEKAGETFADVVNAGVTVEMFKAIKSTQGQDESQSRKKEISDEQKQIDAAKEATLKVIQGSGPEKVGAGEGDLAGKKQDYLDQVTAYQRENKCSRFDAMAAINKQDPESRERYLKAISVS